MAAQNGIRIAIVGGGLAGLAAAMKIAEAGHSVDLFSVVPVKRSHSVCAQGGINGAVNTKGEGDSPWKHFDDTVYGGDFLANQPPVQKMCEMAPSIIYLFDRMGVPFSRTTEGLLDFRRFGGTLHHRTAFAGASTGQQLLYALDEQVRRHEAEGRLKKYEHWEMLSLIQDGHGVCRGLVAMERATLELKAFPATPSSSRPAGRGSSSASRPTRWSAPARPSPPVTSRARATPTASSSRSTRPRSPARTSCASCPNRRAARAGASGCRRRRATSASPRPSPSRSAGTSSKRSTRPTATSSRATSRRARSSRSAWTATASTARTRSTST